MPAIEKTDSLRILHAASLMRPSAGQLQQMNWEQQAASELKLSWRSRMYCPAAACEPSAISVFDEQIISSESSLIIKLEGMLKKLAPFRWLLLRRDYHRWVASQKASYDVVIMRYYVHDPFQWLFVRKASKPVIFYSHTLEVPELKMGGGLPATIRAGLEAIIGPMSLAKADGIVGVTSEVVDYQLSRIKQKNRLTYEYPNGVMDIPDIMVDERSETVPEFLFVANFLPWHGLDDLIDSIKSSSAELVLHVVGVVPNEIKSACADDSRIVLHGQKNGAEIQQLAKKCWVGISSLRLDRKGAKKAATLKAPLYLSMGLPVYGCGDVLPDSLAHYRQGGPDISSLLKFASESRVLTKKTIQTESLPFIDKRLILSNFYSVVSDYFCAAVKEV